MDHHGSTWHWCCWFHANPRPIPLGLEISLAFHRLILIEHLFVRPLSLLHHLLFHTIYGIAVRMYTRVNANLSSLYSGLVHLSDSELFQIDVLGGFARLGVRLLHNNIIYRHTQSLDDSNTQALHLVFHLSLRMTISICQHGTSMRV